MVIESAASSSPATISAPPSAPAISPDASTYHVKVSYKIDQTQGLPLLSGDRSLILKSDCTMKQLLAKFVPLPMTAQYQDISRYSIFNEKLMEYDPDATLSVLFPMHKSDANEPISVIMQRAW